MVEKHFGYWFKHSRIALVSLSLPSKLVAVCLTLMFGLGEIRVYVLDDLLRRLGKDCEVCAHGPAKRRFLTKECCKCIE